MQRRIDRSEVIKLWESGTPRKDIAAIYGVSTERIKQIYNHGKREQEKLGDLPDFFSQLSSRARNALIYHNIKTIGDVRKNLDSLLDFPNLGQKSVKEICLLLKTHE